MDCGVLHVHINVGLFCVLFCAHVCVCFTISNSSELSKPKMQLVTTNMLKFSLFGKAPNMRTLPVLVEHVHVHTFS